MTGLIRKATLLSACALLVATAAMAGVPSPGNCTSPAFIRVVGALTQTATPDSTAGKFSVIVRDLANNPISGSNVVVDFSGCNDIKIASNQIHPYVTNCVTKSVSQNTDGTGTAAFTLLGSSWNAGTYTALGCSKIYADGVLLSSPTVAAFDLDGATGVTTADLSVWLAENGTHRSAVTNTVCP